MVSSDYYLEMTAADGGYDDPGHDECNQTKPCAINERCEQVSINAELQRNICLCDRNNGFRRINGNRNRFNFSLTNIDGLLIV